MSHHHRHSSGWQTFFHLRMLETGPATALLMFDVSCNVALWVLVRAIYLLFDEWRICLALRLLTTSDWHTPDLRLGNFHSFTHTPSRLCCSSVTTSGGGSETVTPLHLRNFHMRWGIGGWFPPWKGKWLNFTCGWPVPLIGSNLVATLRIVSIMAEEEEKSCARQCLLFALSCANTLSQILLLFSEKTKLISWKKSLYR